MTQDVSDASLDEPRLELGDMDAEAWNDFAEAQGWSDGLPLVMPVEEAVNGMLNAYRGDNAPFAPISTSRHGVKTC